MRSDPHKTFSICQDWSPVLIYYVHEGAHACMHAYCVKMCTQLGAVNKLISQPNDVRSSQNFQCMSRLVF